jgi:hypothetical protein
VEIKCQLDATEDFFIADLNACSTSFGHHYAHHQELENITQVVAAFGIWCFGVQIVGMGWNSRLCVRFAGCCSSLQTATANSELVMTKLSLLSVHLSLSVPSTSVDSYHLTSHTSDM